MGLFGKKTERKNQASGNPVTLDSGETVTAATIVGLHRRFLSPASDLYAERTRQGALRRRHRGQGRQSHVHGGAPADHRGERRHPSRDSSPVTPLAGHAEEELNHRRRRHEDPEATPAHCLCRGSGADFGRLHDPRVHPAARRARTLPGRHALLHSAGAQPRHRRADRAGRAHRALQIRGLTWILKQSRCWSVSSSPCTPCTSALPRTTPDDAPANSLLLHRVACRHRGCLCRTVPTHVDVSRRGGRRLATLCRWRNSISSIWAATTGS